MGIDIDQLVQYVIRPTLSQLGMRSLAAERLLVGTALTESRLQYLHQIKGPAVGIYQMEPFTHDDLWETFLEYNPKFAKIIDTMYMSETPDANEMAGNLYYATAMCRIFYRRIKAALPAEGDAMAMALYHKKYYNTFMGKTDPNHSVQFFQTAIERIKE